MQAEVSEPTERYVPDFQYPDGYTVRVSDGEYEVNAREQTLIYRHSMDFNVHHIRIVP